MKLKDIVFGEEYTVRISERRTETPTRVDLLYVEHASGYYKATVVGFEEASGRRTVCVELVVRVPKELRRTEHRPDGTSIRWYGVHLRDEDGSPVTDDHTVTFSVQPSQIVSPWLDVYVAEQSRRAAEQWRLGVGPFADGLQSAN